MFEQSKAAKRRYTNGNFHTMYFRGNGIDVGAGQDSLGRLKMQFPGIIDVRAWDMPDGDAQYLVTIPDNTYDFLHSSHCLEHMEDYGVALYNWIRVVKPGGYLVITIPDETMYEHDEWPSQFNDDHKWSFTLNPTSKLPKSVNVLNMLHKVNDQAVTHKVELITEFYMGPVKRLDQTMLPNTECCIEIILKKV
jgi:SAM-dependent methyltransferase